jgi:hypothetical protein
VKHIEGNLSKKEKLKLEQMEEVQSYQFENKQQEVTVDKMQAILKIADQEMTQCVIVIHYLDVK